MTGIAPGPSRATNRWDAKRLTGWSLMMLVVFLVWAIALSFFGSVVLTPLLDLNEGDLLLMAHGVAGWTAQSIMSALLIAPSVVGVVLAIKALLRGGRALSWTALVLNLAFILNAAFTYLDAIHMTYHPQGGWLFW